MRFSILHGLLLMLLIALAMVYLRMHLANREIQTRIAQRTNEISLLKEEETGLIMSQYGANQMKDYYQTWVDLDHVVQEQFPGLQNRYSRIEPNDDRLVIREMPLLRRVDYKAKAWRVSVPENANLALCLGTDLLELATPIQDHHWSGQSLLQPSGPFSYTLNAGEHLVELRKDDQYQDWTLIVDGKVLWDAHSDNPFDGSTSRGISSAPKQAEVRLDNLPVILEKADFQGATANRLYQLNTILWVDKNGQSFDEFPGAVSAATVSRATAGADQ